MWLRCALDWIVNRFNFTEVGRRNSLEEEVCSSLPQCGIGLWEIIIKKYYKSIQLWSLSLSFTRSLSGTHGNGTPIAFQQCYVYRYLESSALLYGFMMTGVSWGGWERGSFRVWMGRLAAWKIWLIPFKELWRIDFQMYWSFTALPSQSVHLANEMQVICIKCSS